MLARENTGHVFDNLLTEMALPSWTPSPEVCALIDLINFIALVVHNIVFLCTEHNVHFAKIQMYLLPMCLG